MTRTTPFAIHLGFKRLKARTEGRMTTTLAVLLMGFCLAIGGTDSSAVVIGTIPRLIILDPTGLWRLTCGWMGITYELLPNL